MFTESQAYNTLLPRLQRVYKALYDVARVKLLFKQNSSQKCHLQMQLLYCSSVHLLQTTFKANCARNFGQFFRFPFDWFLIHVRRCFVHKTFDIFPCDFKRSNKVFFQLRRAKVFRLMLSAHFNLPAETFWLPNLQQECNQFVCVCMCVSVSATCHAHSAVRCCCSLSET